MKKRLRLGELLISHGKITDEDLSKVLTIQNRTGSKLGEILIGENFISEEEIIEVLELQLGIKYVDLSKFEIDKEIVTILPESLARKYELLAIGKKDNKILLAMVDPLNIFAIDDVQLYLKLEIETVITNRDKLLAAIDRLYSKDSAKRALEEFEERYTPMEIEEISSMEKMEVNSAPIVKLLNSIIEQSVRNKASDIHIEPYDDEVRVRFRIDGDLREIMTLPKSSLAALVTRIKIMGNMNIAEKRIPQDGRVEVYILDRDIDMRISSLPTVYGEKVVIRLLDRSNFMFDKSKLGFSNEDLDKFNHILSQPYGMILVTGPTGSGKSTTLYTVLQELNQIEKNTITIEDPVEYKLKGINQVQVNVKAGLTFASGLRSVLRQDPDIVMLGEIRDGETAEIATRAAITGHLVLSTIHTNDSPSTVARLVDMGIEPYLVGSSVIGVISQRLVKLLCPNCKEEYLASRSEKDLLGYPIDRDLKLYRAKVCNSCNRGYKGRMAVHEIMPITEAIKKEINGRVDINKIKEIALEEGMKTLLESGGRLAINGETSIEEVLRIGFTLE